MAIDAPRGTPGLPRGCQRQRPSTAESRLPDWAQRLEGQAPKITLTTKRGQQRLGSTTVRWDLCHKTETRALSLDNNPRWPGSWGGEKIRYVKDLSAPGKNRASDQRDSGLDSANWCSDAMRDNRRRCVQESLSVVELKNRVCSSSALCWLPDFRPSPSPVTR